MNDFDLYKLYSEENHKYNSIIWQFPTALVALNVLAFEKLLLHAPNRRVVLGILVFNFLMTAFLAKHVYHQGRFTDALKKIAPKLKNEGLTVVEFGKNGKGLTFLKRMRASLWLVRVLFLANIVVYGYILFDIDSLAALQE